MTPILAIRYGVETQIQLLFNDFLHRDVFNSSQIILEALFSFVDSMPNVEELGRAQKGTQMLSPERRSLVKRDRHILEVLNFSVADSEMPIVQ